MIDKNKVMEIIRAGAEILGIPAPNIYFDTSMFGSKTQLAATDGTDIFVKEQYTPQLCFAVLHELRHIWQLKENKLLSHQHINDDIEKYNRQPIEIDANAFALMLMEVFFDYEEEFTSLSDEIYYKICNKADELLKEYFVKVMRVKEKYNLYRL